MQQLRFDFDDKSVELFCPHCLEDRLFVQHPDFDCHVCEACNFSIFVEFEEGVIDETR